MPLLTNPIHHTELVLVCSLKIGHQSAPLVEIDLSLLPPEAFCVLPVIFDTSHTVNKDIDDRYQVPLVPPLDFILSSYALSDREGTAGGSDDGSDAIQRALKCELDGLRRYSPEWEVRSPNTPASLLV